MAKKRPNGPTGFAIVDKPQGWTSHDVVAKARGVFGTRKVGHSGTLDPDATGVLLLGVGKATRILRFLDGATKSYTGEIRFGAETDSLDSTGVVTRTHEMAAIDLGEAQKAAKSLTGDIQQIPPMVSAKKVDGKRLHELAREGIEIERKAADVTVHRFDLEATDDPMTLRCEVDCSSGTYIRSLAADLGAALGGGAHLHGLRRTAIGTFTEADAAPLEEVELRPAAEFLRDLGLIEVDDETALDVRYGRVVDVTRIGVEHAGPYPLVDGAGELLAVYEEHRGSTVKPAVVLAEPPLSTTKTTADLSEDK
ncbi:MAG: tRNA pseudouridine(55) synthase TruB [Acidimicrobiia bacterium]|nr:tRNA pseudouridine(55) synthase TruB [Acidimicrobiia bacterium]